MRIVALGFRGFPNVQGGIEKHCEHLYPRLVKLGCEVIVLGRTPYVRKSPYDFKGVKVIPIWSPKHKLFETVFHTGLCSLLVKKYKPDLVHFHAVGPSIYVPFAKMLGLKVIATHHGFDYDREKWGSLAKLFLKQGERQMCKADRIVAVSEHIRKFLLGKFSCDITTIPNGVDLPDILSPGKYCKKWGLLHGKYFLFAGRLVPEKCVHELLDAFKKIKSNWKLVIAGSADHEGSYSKKLKQQASAINNVVMTGFVTGEELQELYSNAGCFVLPSSHEGLPIALLEALSFGLSCIVSDIAPNRGINHPSVRFFPVHDISALEKLINESINTIPSDDRGNGRAYVAKYFNWDTIASDTYYLMKQIIMH